MLIFTEKLNNPSKISAVCFYFLLVSEKNYMFLVRATSRWPQNWQFLYFNHSGFKYGITWCLWPVCIYHVLFVVEWTKCRNQRLMVLQVEDVVALLNHSHTSSDTFKSDHLFPNCCSFKLHFVLKIVNIKTCVKVTILTCFPLLPVCSHGWLFLCCF